jgi:hypothetical protein
MMNLYRILADDWPSYALMGDEFFIFYFLFFTIFVLIENSIAEAGIMT